jgi:integrase
MASIGRDPGGRKRILFVAPDGKRKTIRLGKASQKTAEAFKIKLEALLRAVATGSPLDDEVAEWLATRGDTMLDKLVAVGLIPKRQVTTLGVFLESYFGERCDIKSGTATAYGHTKRCLIAFFGQSKPLREVSPGDADSWRTWLINNEKLGINTVGRRCGVAKQFFRAALRKRIIRENPFADQKATVQRNRKRDYFITRRESQAVLHACPDAQWRLLFALSRFGGLRCPSEHLGLQWGDIDWERGRMVIHSPKTEHHPGGESRVVPLFPELRPYLEAVWEQAEPGTEYIITRYRDSNVNLRTQLLRIIAKAGLSPWPKLFQNLRASRATELAEIFPSHVAAAWLGHCEAIADKHYRQVTEEHFRKAADGTREAAQKAAHPDASSDCQSLPATNAVCSNPESRHGLQPLAIVGNQRQSTENPYSGRTKIRTWDLVLIRDAL